MGLGFEAGEHEVKLYQLLLDCSLETSIIKGLDGYRKSSIMRQEMRPIQGIAQDLTPKMIPF